MNKEFKFIISFFIFSSLLYFIVLKFYSNDIPIVGTTVVTIILNNILNYFGIDSIQIDDMIYLPNHIKLNIIIECTGIYEMIILSSIVLSYPTNIINKLYGIISGIVIIGILNMIRLITITYILIYYTDKFNFVDTYLWQIGILTFISIAYVIWLKLIK